MSRFDAVYDAGSPPWDIGRPQPELIRLEAEGELLGRVLDAGCGTGEAALYLASRGYKVWGFDFAETAVRRARQKSKQRGLGVRWKVQDLLKLKGAGYAFDTVVDMAVLHTFNDAQWPRYAAGLAAALGPGGRYFGLAFSEKEPAGWGGPRRVTQAQIRQVFAKGWTLEWIRPAKYEVAFRKRPAKAWLAKAVRGWGE
jgi:cyclopropane fatty-acyl-phospholipid synthase-like methyltransferase